MKFKFHFLREIHQFWDSLSLQLVKLMIWIGLYGFFIYRYFLVYEPSLSGNIVTFLHIPEEHSFTNLILLNVTSLLFYLCPLLYLGNQWTQFMTTFNPLIKIRQHFSACHIIVGELLWGIIGMVWFGLNAMIYSLLSLPFSSSDQWIYFMILFMTLSNVLLLFSSWNANLIGWIIILIIFMTCVVYPISLITLIISFLMIFICNVYHIKNSELK